VEMYVIAPLSLCWTISAF